MFTRFKTSPNTTKTSVQIVESIRENGKVRQKIVRHIGNAYDDEELKRLKKLADVTIQKIQAERQPTLFEPEKLVATASQSREENQTEELNVNFKNIREEQRVTVGIHEVYGKVYEQLGLAGVLNRKTNNVSAERILKNIVLGRIANPQSKLATVRELEDQFGIRMSVSSVYRTMDQITEEVVEKLQQRAYDEARNLLGVELNVMFYDCTTLYFESFSEDELKQNGYSKDLKFNQPQVLLALMVTTEGLPVGYEVYPGATFEGNTFQEFVEKLNNKYKINNIVVVADSAMLSKSNMEWMNTKGFKYIVGARIKNTTAAIKKQILLENQYTACDEQHYNRYIDIKTNDQTRLVVTFSESRAAKDAHDREKAIISLCKRLEKSNNVMSLMGNYGYKRFLKIEGDSKLKVDEARLKSASKWDGLHGVKTNIMDLTAQQIRELYHGLWQVEETFRITKHDLSIRPIYHWTPARIRAHIAICFMSLLLVRHLSYRTNLLHFGLSPESTRSHLSHVQVSILRDIQTGKRYALPSKVSPEAVKLYKLMGLKYTDVPYELNT